MKKRAINKSHLLTPMTLLKPLEESDFFVVYPKFATVNFDFRRNYTHFFDNSTEHIEHAARAYFQTIYSVHGNVEVNTKLKANPGKAQVSELKSRIWGN